MGCAGPPAVSRRTPQSRTGRRSLGAVRSDVFPGGPRSRRRSCSAPVVDRRAFWTLPLLVCLIGTTSWALSLRARRASSSLASAGPTIASPRIASPRLDAMAGPVARGSGSIRWIAAGGGSSPELNQIQLEQDVTLAAQVFAPHGEGVVLFAGGAGSNVQVLADDLSAAGLGEQLAELFSPGRSRQTIYRRATLQPDGAASSAGLLSALERAIAEGDAPLTVYLAGHGVGGQAPHESRFLTWGAHDLWVEDLATVLDDAPGHRPVRLVITACYAGGFAELAFHSADPSEGAARTDRCGLFATTWDRASAGCDPNPDRGAQEGYGIHFLHALTGRTRDGAPLESNAIDLDGDGVISLLEAHTRARVASRSLDVPVTTSEHFLRTVVDPEMATDGDAPAVPLIEERAAIAGLTARLELAEPLDVHTRLDALRLRIDEHANVLDRLDAQLDAIEEDLRGALLHRWPVLGDPWHPDFAPTLAAEREAIEGFLNESASAAQRRELLAERERIASAHDTLLVEAAPHERLARALETVRLAAALRAEGGRHWLRYQAFLACERGSP